MTNVVAYRAARKEEFARREGVELTYLPFAIKAVTLALREPRDAEEVTSSALR